MAVEHGIAGVEIAKGDSVVSRGRAGLDFGRERQKARALGMTVATKGQAMFTFLLGGFSQSLTKALLWWPWDHGVTKAP